MRTTTASIEKIIKLFDQYPQLKSKFIVESVNNEFQPIEEAKQTYYGKYYTITNENNDKLICSPEHILFDKHNQEKKVKDIKINELIQTKKGLSKIKSKHLSNNKKKLYDIQVKNTHRYYSNNYLSHNSILQEIISYGLFDKTIRDIEKKDECINNITKKKLLVKIKVDNLKITRGRKPNKLKLRENGKDISLSSMALTQGLIEQKLGINYHTFVNTCCFGQHNNYSFLSANKADKRRIVEDLLQLCEYNKYEENSRKYSRELKSIISNVSSRYEENRQNISSKENQIKTYVSKLKAFKLEVEQEIEKIKSKIEQIEKVDIKKELKSWDEYEEYLEFNLKVIEFNHQIVNKINNLAQKKNEIINATMKKETEIQKKTLPIGNEIKNIKKDLVKINDLKEGMRCSSCYQNIDKSNYGDLKNKLQSQLSELQFSLEDPMQEYKDSKDREKQEIEKINEEKKKIESTKKEQKPVRKPIISKEKLTIQKTEKLHLEKTLKEKEEQSNKSPYLDIITELESSLLEAEKLLVESEQELREKEELLPYYNFWIKGFGDTGVKSFVIEQIIPILNQQINYWLQFLIDNKIIVKFDKFLNVEITRPNDLGEFTYGQASGGEKKRIDLAITLAFAHIMKLRSNTNNNILFLDELAESIDVVEGIYRTLMELSKNCTVFLITHRPDLLNALEAKKKITMVKEGGFSKILSLE